LISSIDEKKKKKARHQIFEAVHFLRSRPLVQAKLRAGRLPRSAWWLGDVVVIGFSSTVASRSSCRWHSPSPDSPSASSASSSDVRLTSPTPGTSVYLCLISRKKVFFFFFFFFVFRCMPPSLPPQQNRVHSDALAFLQVACHPAIHPTP
jgi:hypothetical protein